MLEKPSRSEWVDMKIIIPPKLKNVFIENQDVNGGKKLLLGDVLISVLETAWKKEEFLEQELKKKNEEKFDPLLISVKTEKHFKEKIYRPVNWARVMAHSGSQDLIDSMRKMFPKNWIPGHTKISGGKVSVVLLSLKLCNESNDLLFFFFVCLSVCLIRNY